MVGALLIIYIGLGLVYFQQGAQQREFEKQVTKLSVVLARPMPGAEKLEAELEEVNRALAPIPSSDAIAMLVGIAEENGIDVALEAGKFIVPPAGFSQATVGASSYRVLSFSGIRVQGDPENVMTFISDLDSGKTLKTMVLKSVTIREVEVGLIGEEAARRAEFSKVASKLEEMMQSDNLSVIPNPISFAGGMATNLMGDDPATGETVEGFPDILTTAAEKGYTGTASPRAGYVLYNHDKVSTDNTTLFQTVSYIDVLTTEYYYTCEADGTVRQFDGADVATATEYLTRGESKIEIAATVTVEIYTKP